MSLTLHIDVEDVDARFLVAMGDLVDLPDGTYEFTEQGAAGFWAAFRAVTNPKNQEQN